MGDDESAADLVHEATLDVQLEVYAKAYLSEEQPIKGRGKGGVDVRSKLAAFVPVAKDVAGYGKKSAERLEGDVQTRADDLVVNRAWNQLVVVVIVVGIID